MGLLKPLFTAFLGIALVSCSGNTGSFSQRIPKVFKSCGSGFSHGQSQSRTRYLFGNSQFDPLDPQKRIYHCESETQTRVCNDGTAGQWSGHGDQWPFTDCVKQNLGCPATPAMKAIGQKDLADGETDVRSPVAQSGSVAFGQSCEWATLTDSCSDGTRTTTSSRTDALKNSSIGWTALSCQAGPASDCGSIRHGTEESRTRANQATAVIRNGEACNIEDQRRLCTNGTLSSWYLAGSNPHVAPQYGDSNPSSCSADRSCSNGMADGASQNQSFYKNSAPPFAPGCEQVSYSLSCSNGSLSKLSPSFSPAQSPEPANWQSWSSTSCTATARGCSVQDGAGTLQFAHGETRSWTRYKDGTVVQPEKCESATVTGTCLDGTIVNITYQPPTGSSYSQLACSENENPGCLNPSGVRFKLDDFDVRIRYQSKTVSWASSCQSETQKAQCLANSQFSAWTPNTYSELSCSKTSAGLSLNYNYSPEFCFNENYSTLSIPVSMNSNVPSGFIYRIVSVSGQTSIPNGISIDSQTGAISIGRSTPELASGSYSMIIHASPDRSIYTSADIPDYDPNSPSTFVAGTASFTVADCGSLFDILFGNPTCQRPNQAFTASPSKLTLADPSWILSLSANPTFSLSNQTGSKGAVTVPAGTPNQTATFIAKDTSGIEKGRVNASLNIQDCSIGTLSYSFSDLQNPRSTDSLFASTLGGNISTSATKQFVLIAEVRSGGSWISTNAIAITADTGEIKVSKSAPTGEYRITVNAALSSSDLNQGKVITFSGTLNITAAPTGSLTYADIGQRCFAGANSSFVIPNHSAPLTNVDRYVLESGQSSQYSIDSVTGDITVSAPLAVGSYSIIVHATNQDYDKDNPSTFIRKSVPLTIVQCSSLLDVSYPGACPGTTVAATKLKKPSGWTLSYEPLASGLSINSADAWVIPSTQAPGDYSGSIVATDPNDSNVKISIAIVLSVLSDCAPRPAEFVWMSPNGIVNEYDFGEQLIGVPSDIFEFTLMNYGGTDAVIGSILSDGNEFEIVEPYAPKDPLSIKCVSGKTVLKSTAGNRCVIGIRFKPTDIGPRAGLLVSTPEKGLSAEVKLTGTGKAGFIAQENQTTRTFTAPFAGTRLFLDHSRGQNGEAGSMNAIVKDLPGLWTQPETYRGPATQMAYSPLFGYQTQTTGLGTDQLEFSENNAQKTSSIYVQKNPTGCGKLRVTHYRGVAPENNQNPAFDPRPGAGIDGRTFINPRGEPLSAPIDLAQESDTVEIYPGINRTSFAQQNFPRSMYPFWRAEADGGVDHFVSDPSSRFSYRMGYYPTGLKSRPFFSGNNHDIATSDWDERNHVFHTFKLDQTATVTDSNGDTHTVGPENICGFTLQVSAWDDQRDRYTSEREANHFIRLISTAETDKPVLYAMRLEDLHHPYPHRLLNLPTAFTRWLDRTWGYFTGTELGTHRRLYILDSNNIPGGLYGYNYSSGILGGINDELNVHLATPGMNIESLSVMVFYDPDKKRDLPKKIDITGGNSDQFCGSDGKFKGFEKGIQKDIFGSTDDLEAYLSENGYFGKDSKGNNILPDPSLSRLVKEGYKDCGSGWTENLNIRCEGGESLQGFLTRIAAEYKAFVAAAEQKKGKGNIFADCPDCKEESITLQCPECALPTGELSEKSTPPLESDGSALLDMTLSGEKRFYVYSCDSNGMSLSLKEKWNSILQQVRGTCKNAVLKDSSGLSKKDDKDSYSTDSSADDDFKKVFGMSDEKGNWSETDLTSKELRASSCQCTSQEQTSSIIRWTGKTCSNKGEKCTLSYPSKLSCKTVSRVHGGKIVPTFYEEIDGAKATLSGKTPPCPTVDPKQSLIEQKTAFTSDKNLFLEPICNYCPKPPGKGVPEFVGSFYDPTTYCADSKGKSQNRTCREKTTFRADGSEVSTFFWEYDLKSKDLAGLSANVPSCCNPKNSPTYDMNGNPVFDPANTRTIPLGEFYVSVENGLIDSKKCWKKVSCTEKLGCEDSPAPARWKYSIGTEFSPTDIDPKLIPFVTEGCASLKAGSFKSSGVITQNPDPTTVCGYVDGPTKGCTNGALNPPKCNLCQPGYYFDGIRCKKSIGTGGGGAGGGIGSHHEGPVDINAASSKETPPYP